MPVGAYGGRRELMQQIAPAGPVYQAGTLSGNPVAMAAGLAMLELIQAHGFHADLERRPNVLCDGLEAAAVEARSEEHTSELQSLMRRSSACFCMQEQTYSNVVSD